MISIARDTTRNVKRWRDGKMIKRWCAAGVLNAERSVRGRKDCRQCRRSSPRSPVTSKLFHRHAMLDASHEGTNGRPTARWSRLVADARTTSAPSLERSVNMKPPQIVSPEEWEAAHQDLLVKE